MVDKISKMRRVAMVLAEELGREPTDEELAEEIGIDRAKLAHLKSAALRPASLDAPISDDDSTEFGEIVGDEKAQTPFELLSHKNMHCQLDGLLEVLDERERRSSMPASASTARSRRPWRKSARNSASPASGSASCRTSR